MKRLATPAVIFLALALTGCASAEPTSASTPPSVAPVSGESDNVTACEYIADTALPDAVDFFETYNVARDTADPAQLDAVVNRFNVSLSKATGDVETGISATLVELEAIQSRYKTGDPVNPEVNYQALADSLDDVMGACLEVLGG